MHELSVTQSILEIAMRHAQQAHARQIISLNLAIGQLSSIVDDSVQFYWDFVTQDTIAQGSKLHFRRIPARLACLDCEQTFTPDGRDFACPACESIKVKIISGQEFQVESIEIE
jgi:hydrogenase nickel incorporation protein HypA/HybF